MSGTVDICIVCAWRADCQKKFSISGKDIRCADFSRDVSISKPEEGQSTENSYVEKK